MKSIFVRSVFYLLLLLALSAGCSEKEGMNFVRLTPSHTNIHFSNDVENTPEFSIQNYLYFYDGGGVAAGDINNDGLPDLFFTGNEVANKLYLNRGDFTFEDISKSAGIVHYNDSWSTGVTMADVNGDGYLDIYVSQVNYLIKKGANQLYINNGDLTFTEQAAGFGLDFKGYATQAVFFDYDNEGDLDLFLLNHSFHSDDTYGPAEELRQKPHPKAGDRLFRNDGSIFTDVTKGSGIFSSALGYGLGVAVTDINRDGFMDIYVGNDFHEADYFYMNNGDGTFSESLYSMIGHTSGSSMGNDAGDINNDGLTDIVSLDMMPDNHEAYMRSGGPDLVLIAETKKRFGFGEKNNRNTLQVHRGMAKDGLPRFSETAFASGIAKTEWSWAPLLADFNNNGFQDLYITNGLPKRPNDLDYVAVLQRARQQYTGEGEEKHVYELLERMPSVHVSNYMFRNNKDLTFSNVTTEWGLNEPSYSNGAAYADLNLDGKLDIIVNNINSKALIYQNNTAGEGSAHYLKVNLNGDSPNTSGIGSKLFAYKNGSVMYREQMPVRGFQSSVDHTLHFGLGSSSGLDSLLVIWPDNRYQVLYDIPGNQALEVQQTDASGTFEYESLNRTAGTELFTDITPQTGINHSHSENSFDDFNREPLMPFKLSAKGPALAVVDVTGDGLDDYYLGGAGGFPGKLFLQQSDGSFLESDENNFEADRRSEDVDAVFFDATGDGRQDLYVVSGGNEYSGQVVELLDRLYINQGEGKFRKSVNSIPQFSVNTSVVRAADFNGDGSQDLFTGGHSVPWRYGVGPQSFLLENNGKGVFRDVTEEAAPGLETVGNVTSAAWVYQSGKSLPDLIIAGEWMNVHYFENQKGKLINKTEAFGLEGLGGLWQSIHTEDMDGNGHADIILGNFGLNSRVKASAESPLKLYINDFNNNGQTAPVVAYVVEGQEKPFEQLDEILAQIPAVKENISSYRDFAEKNIDEIFHPEKLDSALQKDIHELRSVILFNNGDRSFTRKNLPVEAQLFPVLAIHADDYDDDGMMDILLGGNFYDVKPGMGGRQDAGFGLVLLGREDRHFDVLQYQQSGFFLDGEVRSIQAIGMNHRSKHVIVARNDDTPLIFRVRSNNE